MSAAAPDVSVVLPCYNERDNVELEVKRIRAALDETGLRSPSSSPATRGLARPPHRHPDGTGSGGRLDRRRPDLPQRAHPRADRCPGRHLRPSGRRPHQRGGTYKLLRVPAKWAIRRLASWLTNMPIPDLNAGLRAFKRSVAEPYLRLLPPGSRA